MSKDVLFQLTDLFFSFNHKPALQIENLSLSSGKIYVLMGPNGSGKTTLLKILNGLLKVNKGMVSYKGSDIQTEQYIKIRQETAFVHQNPLLLTGTVEKNLSFGMKIKKIPEKEFIQRLKESIDSMGLQGYEKRKHTDLSIGEIQRIAISRAISLSPVVLLLDEPTANLDQESIERLELIIKNMKDQGKTVIFSSHNLLFGSRMQDEVIVLDKGKIVNN